MSAGETLAAAIIAVAVVLASLINEKQGREIAELTHIVCTDHPAASICGHSNRKE